MFDRQKLEPVEKLQGKQPNTNIEQQPDNTIHHLYYHCRIETMKLRILL